MAPVMSVGFHYDYVETALRLAEEQRHTPSTRYVDFESDHVCDPSFVFSFESFKVVPGWDGMVGKGYCPKCERTACLRVPRVLVVAARLLRCAPM